MSTQSNLHKIHGRHIYPFNQFPPSLVAALPIGTFTSPSVLLMPDILVSFAAETTVQCILVMEM